MGGKPRPSKATSLNNCPIRERTADGVSVGRCWHWLGWDGERICERHGDVNAQVEAYIKTGQLQEDPRDGRQTKKD